MKAYFLWLAKFLTTILVFLFFIPIAIAVLFGGMAAIKSTNEPIVINPEYQVGVVELSGPIMESKEIVKKLHEQVKNENLKGIVLRINSPGGAVAPSQDIFRAVQRLKKIKPIIVSMGTVAASGGLYSALGASKIFVQPGTQTGSIGVIVQIPNFHKLTGKYGVDFLTVKSGELKDVGNPTRALTEQDRSFLQKTVNKIYSQFFDDVVQARQLDPEKVKEFADGRLILGNEAVELGLADAIGDVYDASLEVFQILKTPLPKGEYPKLVYSDDKFAKFKKLLEGLVDVPFKLSNPDYFSYQRPRILLF